MALASKTKGYQLITEEIKIPAHVKKLIDTFDQVACTKDTDKEHKKKDS